MKKEGILNSDISRVLSYMGHTDWICIGDCGLPIPDEEERIDLALEFGVPTFMKTLEVVAKDMKDARYHQPIFKVDAVDTTAAGDTFTGYFLAGIIDGMEIPDILKMSAKAPSIAVTRKGAVPSIPYKKEVLESL